MCGVNGIISSFYSKEELSRNINVMNETIRHRGPDGQDILVRDELALGHTRLSIIDLTDNANQPMISLNKRFFISFNGEIYNFKELRSSLQKRGVNLRTGSDTEVILELFSLEGITSINKLRGMFAIAIWDDFKRELFIFRDRFGIKPMYYNFTERSELIFSSEIKGIASIKKNLSVNWNSFTNFFRTSFYTEDETVFKEIKKLKPGHYIYFNLKTKSIEIKQYYDVKKIYESGILEGDEKELTDLLMNKLDESVKYHLVSDVPVGSFLSGGLDSSLITAFMRKNLDNKSINSSSIVYNESYNGNNEEAYSDIVANYLDTNHKKVILDSKIFKEMEKLAWYADEPIGAMSSYAIYYLSKAARENNKVVLTGDGADELLGGYNGLYQPLEHKFNNYKSFFGLSAKLLSPFVDNLNQSQKYKYSRLVDYSQDNGYNFSNQASYNNTDVLCMLNNNLFKSGLENWQNNNKRYYYNELDNQSDIRRKTYSLIKTRLVDEMLTKVDRMTMAHSIEARVPFLDHELAELCIRLPDYLKYNILRQEGQRNKYGLRMIGEQLLPKEINERRKQGFNVPFYDWVSKENNDVKETIMEGQLVKNQIVIKSEFELYLNKTKTGLPVLNMLSFEKWYTAYKNKLPQLNISF